MRSFPNPIPLALALLCTITSVGAVAAPRQRIRMDSGWRFHRGDIGAQAGQAVGQWRWRESERGEAEAAQMAAPDATTNDPAWKTAQPGEDTFHGRVGYAWYRAPLPDVPGPHRRLHFASVDDNAVVFVNGQRLLSHAGWNDPFDVSLDGAWRPGGPNVVAVLVENTNGAGGIGAAYVESVRFETPEPARINYDDRAWRTVQVPHDFVVEGSFSPQADLSHGFLPTDVGWYRKSFTLPASAKGRSVWIDFDGIYRDSQIWLNGRLLGRHPSGYTSFRYDITRVANYGAPNLLAVRADARASEGWWYEGGGIYRHVWLNVADPMHIPPWGNYVASTVSDASSPTPASANLTVRTSVVNDSAVRQDCLVTWTVLDPAGRQVARGSRLERFAPGGSGEITQFMRLDRPMLWSLETPRLYTLVTALGGGSTDTVSTRFGIRTIRFDPQLGFFLNNKPVKIKGTCNHQDHAGVGVAVPDSLLAWRIQRLKEMGCNAYRCAHNPPASELLDVCDRLGMLVMDENRHLGDTYSDHTPSGTPYSDLSDLASMIQRDRNHPSIIMWSMCNEEGLQSTEEGARIFSAMEAVVRRYDDTRPITCAMNGGWGRGISNVEDLQGCNYNPGGYDRFHELYPQKPMYGSETGSTVSTRGEYVNDRAKGYVSAYDVNAPPWAQTAEAAWKPIADRPFVAGGYMWTGFDYRGEPTPYGWPCVNSHFGILDTCGFAKDNFYYYQAWWGDKPVAHLLPHWNWRGKEGQPVDVWCYSNCERVELFLNGTSLGTQAMPANGHVAWQVPYTPGKLEVHAYRGEAVAATDTVETTGPPAALRLTATKTDLAADGEDAAEVMVEVVDAAGRVVPVADDEVTFSAAGPARISGVGNGDPSSHEPDRATRRHAFNGRCAAIVQADERSGPARITATAPGLKAATVELTVTMRRSQ